MKEKLFAIIFSGIMMLSIEACSKIKESEQKQENSTVENETTMISEFYNITEYKEIYTMLEYPLVDFTEYSVMLKDETQLYKDTVFSVHLPSNWNIKFEIPNTIAYESENQSSSILIATGELFYSFEKLFPDTDVSQENMNTFFALLGYDIPQNLFDFQYIIASLNWNDFNFRSPFDSDAFMVLAKEKESFIHLSPNGVIYYESSEVKGFIFQKSNYYIVNLFSVADPIQNITIIMEEANNINILWGVINSITIN